MNTEMGQTIVPYVHMGELVPANIVHEIMQNVLSRPEARLGYVMNGYPRTAESAETFLRTEQPSLAFVLHVGEPTVRLRLELRARFDDVPGVIDRRLRHYHERMPGVLLRLKKAGIPIVQIDGEPRVAEVTDLLIHAISRLSAPSRARQKEQADLTKRVQSI